MRTKALMGTILLTALGFLWTGVYATEHSSRLPKGLRSGFGTVLRLEKTSAERITSVLGGLQKNLILEATRAQRDVGLYKRSAPAVVLVAPKALDSFGSGAIIDAKGHIITNWHVVGGEEEVFVAFKPKDGSELTKELVFRAIVERTDEVADLALLRITQPPKTLAYLALGNTSKLAVGQDVHAIGHPSGEVWTYTKGIISQIRNNYQWEGDKDKTLHRAKVIQTQTPINPGNSGGPLLDDNGRLIGINSFTRSGSEGLNYAVAVDEIQKFLDRPESRRAARKPVPEKADLNCPEAYDTKGQRWSNILGCYSSRTSPPPDLWVVFDAPKSVSYIAKSTIAAGNIDTLITNVDPNWQTLLYAIDVDCDGIVDVIGQRYSGRSELDSYRYPKETVRLVTYATELDTALRMGKISYPQLQVCQ